MSVRVYQCAGSVHTGSLQTGEEFFTKAVTAGSNGVPALPDGLLRRLDLRPCQLRQLRSGGRLKFPQLLATGMFWQRGQD